MQPPVADMIFFLFSGRALYIEIVCSSSHPIKFLLLLPVCLTTTNPSSFLLPSKRNLVLRFGDVPVRRFVELLHKVEQIVHAARALARLHADKVVQAVGVGCGESVKR